MSLFLRDQLLKAGLVDDLLLYVAHALKLPLAWFEKRHLGDVVSRMGAVQAIQRTLTTSFIEAIIDGLMAVATLASSSSKLGSGWSRMAVSGLARKFWTMISWICPWAR